MRAYIAEEITPFYRKLKTSLPNLIGSEFIGPNIQSGKKVSTGKFLKRVRHEDLTNLSFESNSIDLMITLDVFEYIPNFQGAFEESFRILDKNGIWFLRSHFSFTGKKQQSEQLLIAREELITFFLPRFMEIQYPRMVLYVFRILDGMFWIH